MIELNEKAGIYAEENVINILKDAITKVYADGYRDGYRDCKDNIPADLRNQKTEYVDLGLKSKTLWSKDYEKDGCEIKYLPYCCANTLNIPTEKQWEELFKYCKWEITTDHQLATDKVLKEVLCIGPNGNSIKFNLTGFYSDKELKNNGFVYCWLKGDNELNSVEKSCGYIGRNWVGRETLNNILYDYYQTKYSIIKQFSGYRLPIRLVMNI